MNPLIKKFGSCLFFLPLFFLFINCKESSKEQTSIKKTALEASFYCHNGAYIMEDGRIFIIGPSDNPNLRYRLPDGTTGKLFPQENGTFISGKGWANKADPHIEMNLGSCNDSSINITENGITQKGSIIQFPLEELTFNSKGNTLYGELYYPVNNTPKAVVVLQAGSGKASAVNNSFLQYVFPLNDIAVFVFDKQGTGNSEGTFTADFVTLANDMAAAVNKIKTVFNDVSIPIGVLGESQGGWITPLTASKTQVDFVIASYGLTISPAEENRLEVIQQLNSQNYGEEVIKQAEEVIAVTNLIFESKFTKGLDELAILKGEYGNNQWYKELDGDYTGLIANAGPEEMKEYKEQFNYDIDLYYDAVTPLYAVDVPMLWVLAEMDTEAPFKETFAIVKKLQEDGSKTDIAVFPNAEHGMIIVENTPEGIQHTGRYAEGYFDLLKDWILTQSFDRQYGEARQFEYKR